jgi:hypothetical protein
MAVGAMLAFPHSCAGYAWGPEGELLHDVIVNCCLHATRSFVKCALLPVMSVHHSGVWQKSRVLNHPGWVSATACALAIQHHPCGAKGPGGQVIGGQPHSPRSALGHGRPADVVSAARLTTKGVQGATLKQQLKLLAMQVCRLNSSLLVLGSDYTSNACQSMCDAIHMPAGESMPNFSNMVKQRGNSAVPSPGHLIE